MRTIKFRAWDGETRTMLYPGALGIRSFFLNLEVSRAGYKADLALPFVPGDSYNQTGMELMQWVGHHDQKGAEIYEGDILRGTRRTKSRNGMQEDVEMIFIVYYDEGHAAFKVNYPKMKWRSFFGQDAPYTVIGDIYRNPELLG